jgi:hypothetical protein
MSARPTCPQHPGVYRPCHHCDPEGRAALKAKRLVALTNRVIAAEVAINELTSKEAPVLASVPDTAAALLNGAVSETISIPNRSIQPTLSDDLFPATRLTVNPIILRAMAAFVSDDEERPVLTGIHVALRPLSVQLSATDSLAAAMYREVIGDELTYLVAIECEEPAEYIIPVAAVMPMLKLKFKYPEPITITSRVGELLFTRGPWSVHLPTIEGKFPDIGEFLKGDAEPLDQPLLGLGRPFASFLAFADVLKTSGNVHMTLHGTNKVIGVRYSGSDLLRDTFIGAIMPVKTSEVLEDNVFDKPAWLQLQLDDPA